MKNYSFD